jgi:dimethylargininase
MRHPTVALVRRPPRSYAPFYAPHGVTIDPLLADRQHAAYVAALSEAGLAIEWIEPDERFPDGVFIEDTAVVWEDRALRTRMAPHREGEQDAVLAHLRARCEIVTLPDNATLDGGDVLHAGDVTYVGQSTRTNAAGASALRAFLAPARRRVLEVPVEHTLHLKSAATWLGNDTILAAHDHVDISHFGADRVLFTAEGEEKAANALRVNDHLIALAGYPETAVTLRDIAQYRKLALHLLDMSEFEKGDGSLTCLSIII